MIAVRTPRLSVETWLDLILSEAVKELRVTEDELRSSKRVFVEDRQLVMYVMDSLTSATPTQIGEVFGKHRTTVTYSLGRVHGRIVADEALWRETVGRLRRRVLWRVGEL